ncbi:glycerophosphodiester phosphodiesterase [Aureicoccus marinus]|jgi:glycerophosphoryl diester phosphodiesterase|uniref:Glycerophosphodiester phosphodiesterase n=1 Tax=Aureicoccus marinus TaxID=754435 RepID=A0A2S7T978_9FLAO|nr:glycerophosphodiester phosphodiesterase family protein [Aureicoccus marinus]PQJ16482.1 glycerophosphodiester phosphodiesterase [Aureicoccus marinus]
MKKYLGLVLVMMMFTSCQKRDFKVIGHRGAMGYVTENSLPSIQKAMDMGVDMIEIDVFEIKSKEVVVFHDEELDALTNGSGRIEDYNIFELRQLQLKGGHEIPMLQDVMKLIDNKVPLNIELKGKNTAPRVQSIVKNYIERQGWSKENIVISSFHWDALREMRRLDPDIAIAVLTEEDPLEALDVAKELKAIAINPWFKNLTREQVQAIQEAGFMVYTYTVNEPKDIARMKEWQVDGIFTNYPDRAQ